jgi:hypothetical protein
MEYECMLYRIHHQTHRWPHSQRLIDALGEQRHSRQVVVPTVSEYEYSEYEYSEHEYSA